jgi:hypothetical protein
MQVLLTIAAVVIPVYIINEEQDKSASRLGSVLPLLPLAPPPPAACCLPLAPALPPIL